MLDLCSPILFITTRIEQTETPIPECSLALLSSLLSYGLPWSVSEPLVLLVSGLLSLKSTLSYFEWPIDLVHQDELRAAAADASRSAKKGTPFHDYGGTRNRTGLGYLSASVPPVQGAPPATRPPAVVTQTWVHHSEPAPSPGASGSSGPPAPADPLTPHACGADPTMANWNRSGVWGSRPPPRLTSLEGEHARCRLALHLAPSPEGLSAR